MKTGFFWIPASCMLAALLIACEKKDVPAAVNGDGEELRAYFSQKTCREVIVREIERAKSRICVQAYSFTSEEIVNALAEAKARGVRVTIILDSEKAEKRSEHRILRGKGLDTYIDSEHGKAHNKVILIDGETIITGSFNFADPRFESAENILVIKNSPRVMAAYEENFQEHLRHSEKGV